VYLRCDGTITYDTNGTVRCTDWAEISSAELLDNVVTTYQLSAVDYAELSAFTFLAFVLAAGFRFLVKSFLMNAEH
jgi:hypothetical protein